MFQFLIGSYLKKNICYLIFIMKTSFKIIVIIRELLTINLQYYKYAKNFYKYNNPSLHRNKPRDKAEI